MIQRQFSPGNLAMMGTSVWDGRESKKETKHPLQKKREKVRQIKVIYAGTLLGKNNTSRTEVKKIQDATLVC